jgi:hypothetical protein
MSAPTIVPGLCACGTVASRPHTCRYRLPLPAESPGHAAGMVHPAPVPGCPWCRPVECPCGGGCTDAAGCRRRWHGSETTWRQPAAPELTVGVATYSGMWWR